MRRFVPIPIVAVALTFTGCAITSPALGGKTIYDKEFVDEVPAVRDAEGNVTDAGQRTTYRISARVPAGVELDEAATDFSYVWDNSDEKSVGSVGIGGKAGAYSTTQQSAALVTVSQYQAEAISAITQALFKAALEFATSQVAQSYVDGANAVDLHKAQNPQPDQLSALLQQLLATQGQGTGTTPLLDMIAPTN